MEDFLNLFSAVTLSLILVCVTVIVTGILEKFANQNRQEQNVDTASNAPLAQRKLGRNLFF